MGNESVFVRPLQGRLWFFGRVYPGIMPFGHSPWAGGWPAVGGVAGAVTGRGVNPLTTEGNRGVNPLATEGDRGVNPLATGAGGISNLFAFDECGRRPLTH